MKSLLKNGTRAAANVGDKAFDVFADVLWQAITFHPVQKLRKRRQTA